MKFRLLLAAFVSIALATGCAHTKQLKTDLDDCQAQLAAQSKTCAAAGEDAKLALARASAYRDLAKQLRDALGDADFDIAIVDGRLVLRLPTSILFESGKAKISKSGEQTLAKVASVIKNRERMFIIGGHTDNVPIRQKDAGYDSNRHLGWKRADNARKTLVSNGVAEKQLATAGFGEFFPTASNDTEAGRKQNRRIEIIVLPKASELPQIPTDI